MDIAIVGRGNVATHLFKALEGKADIHMVNPHTLEGMPEHVDIAIISVKDDVVAEMAERIKGRAGIVAHTSGSCPLDCLKGSAPSTGVFYPMQTFTKGVDLDYSEIPFFIEGSDEKTEKKLMDLARLISGNVRKADSIGRRQLHLAAVFACNFTNRMMGIADEILKEHGMDYTVMLPLLKQTMEKLSSIPPGEAQTGPAVRGDMGVMQAHLKMLEDKPELRDIYKLISRNINPDILI